MEVRVDLAQIIISESQESQVIMLRERDGNRRLRIVIGAAEAFAIDRRLKGHFHERPLTHDLMSNIIEELGGDLEKIVINDLRNGTFYAQLVIRIRGELVEVDSRPSDAIALGVAGEAPIYIEDHVLQEAGHEG